MVKKTAAPKNFENLLKAHLRQAPISHFLGHRLTVCKDGRQLIVCEMIVYGRRHRKIALASGTYARLDQSWT